VFKLRVSVGVTAMLIAALAAGCGSSDSSTETTTTATTATTGANERLTTAQWEEYQTSRAALRKANAAATATLKKCSAVSGFQDSADLQACVGDTFTTLATATAESYTTVEGFQSTVSGDCATATDALLNNLGTYRASAAQMQTTIDSATLAGYPAASQDLQVSLTSGKAEAQTFEKDCAPV
jgi:hypothetical protein